MSFTGHVRRSWLAFSALVACPLNEDWIPERGARMARREDREYREL
jgi:hypothetical protein